MLDMNMQYYAKPFARSPRKAGGGEVFTDPHALRLFNRLFVKKGLTAGTAESTRMYVETALLYLWLPLYLEGTETCSKATQFVTFCDE